MDFRQCWPGAGLSLPRGVNPPVYAVSDSSRLSAKAERRQIRFPDPWVRLLRLVVI